MTGAGGHRQAPQLQIAGAGQPGEQRVAVARAQHLLGRPQGIAPAWRTDHDKLRQIYPRGGERGCIRQVGRRKPGHALALPGQRRKRRQDQLQFPYPFTLAQELRKSACRPSTTR